MGRGVMFGDVVHDRFLFLLPSPKGRQKCPFGQVSGSGDRKPRDDPVDQRPPRVAAC